MRTTPIRRAVAAGASVALATVGLAAFAPAATAAPVTTSLKFDCTVSILTDQEFVFDATLDVPETAEQGKPLKLAFEGTVTAPNTVRQSAYYILNVRALSGTADIDAKFGGQDLPLTASVARTEVPGGTTPTPLVLPAEGSGTVTPNAVGPQAISIAGFKANLTSEKADGSKETVAATCVAQYATAAVGTVNVTKATVQSTSTTAKVKVAKKAKKATATVKVVNADKSAAKGKVKVTLKKGKKTVGNKTVSLNKKGQAKAVFKKLKKGKYTLVAQYQGTKESKKSQKKVTFRVR